jgi:hypothetical protein
METQTEVKPGKTKAAPVTVENFIRAESDMYFSLVAIKQNGFGKFNHHRELSPIDDQIIVRLNRDTLYSAAVFDLEAGPVTITMPDAGSRFMSLQSISEDEYCLPTRYEPGPFTLTKEKIGTRYVLVGVRTLVDPNDPADVEKVHKLQDAIKVDQPGGPGTFEVTKWDAVSQKKVRDALITLATTLTDTSHSFGTKEEVDPIRRLASAAATWGGNSEKDAIYLNFTPVNNDGKTSYKLNVRDVPVDGFWSVIVYNKEGYIPENNRKVYSFNNLTAKKDVDGSVTIQFGNCENANGNCIPIVQDWSYTVRLYRPRKEILDGTWKFPEAQEVQ